MLLRTMPGLFSITPSSMITTISSFIMRPVGKERNRMDARTILEMVVIMLDGVIENNPGIVRNNIQAMGIYALAVPDEYRTAIGLIQEQIDRLYQEPEKEQPTNE